MERRSRQRNARGGRGVLRSLSVTCRKY
jgi:hypothetical protein